MAAQPFSWLPSIAYPPAQDGFWSPVTSTLNWCEEDYYVTIYAAEIVNTLTNLLFMYLAAKGIQNCLNNGHDKVFVVTFIGYLLVGMGSFMFHASLTYPMQLVDELSMIYTTCLTCFATFSYGKSKLYSQVLAVLLVGLALFITLYYHYLQDPTFHQNAYAILTSIVLVRSMYLMEVNLRPRFRAKKSKTERSPSKDQQAREDLRDDKIIRKMWTLIVWGLTFFLGGFAIWTLDNEACSTLRQWRRQIGMPWGFLLEGHGWWHVGTGIGAYYYIVWGIWLRHCLNGKQDDYELVWPAWYTLPVIVRTSKASANGHINGHANGHTNGSVKKEL
ncbi:alkaline ceramidase-like protein [Pleomassaria siparia CBS 279.74]|uniref:Alkaline ceramidase-like protein n=1 Tax=Pleomassaria siparia CBS 279.74 TaxID=1314801 RepID=A0A6G1JWD8_9PLEO|nr:alkaline ceramidase-like protein [Pleomassaria siparia CBS 279.74]